MRLTDEAAFSRKVKSQARLWITYAVKHIGINQSNIFQNKPSANIGKVLKTKKLIIFIGLFQGLLQKTIKK